MCWKYLKKYVFIKVQLIKSRGAQRFDRLRAAYRVLGKACTPDVE